MNVTVSRGIGKGSRGFSLVEVLAVSVLLTLLLAVMYPLIHEGWRNWHHTGVRTELRNAANLVMGAIEKDLLRAAVADGQEAVAISGDRLKIVTAWDAGATPQAASPKTVIVYSIVREPGMHRTFLYRYAGPPSASLGMRLAGEDVDFSGSEFQRQPRQRVLVKLCLQERHRKLHSVASYRYGYGALPPSGA